MGGPDDELALIRAASGGDADAFARLYAGHVAAVTRRISHLVGPAMNVEDLVQDTFLRALRALATFRGDRPFRHWLLRVAMSVVRDEQRRARRSIWRLFTRTERIDATATAGARADAYGDLAAVHRALAELSPKLREVLVLFELEGVGLAEIAAELDVPLHTVGSRLRRGRQRLRSLLERSGYGDLAPAPSMVPIRERT